MAVTAATFLAPPDGTGELEPRWFDWLPLPGSGQTQVEALTEKLDAWIAASATLLGNAGVAVTDAAQTAYVYWQAYGSLCKEYSRRIGTTTIVNEVTQQAPSSIAKPFCDAAADWKLVWNTFVPDTTGVGGGMGVSASVPSKFTF